MVVTDYKSYNKGLIFKGAPHMEKQLSVKDSKQLLKEKKALFVRNSYDFDTDEETSFWFVIKDSFGGMEELKSKIRNQVRRALRDLDILPISKDFLVESGGYEVYLKSYERYRDIVYSPLPKNQWCTSLSNNEGIFEYWGAIDKKTGILIAYSENLIQDNMCKYTALKAIPEFLNKSYPFYGLLYLMNEHYLEERKLLYVTDGSRSITTHSNIQSFLDKFNFRKAYCQMSVMYTPWLSSVVKILYPFRNIIPIKRLQYLLIQEAMQKGNI